MEKEVKSRYLTVLGFTRKTSIIGVVEGNPSKVAWMCLVSDDPVHVCATLRCCLHATCLNVCMGPLIPLGPPAPLA